MSDINDAFKKLSPAARRRLLKNLTKDDEEYEESDGEPDDKRPEPSASMSAEAVEKRRRDAAAQRNRERVAASEGVDVSDLDQDNNVKPGAKKKKKFSLLKKFLGEE